MHSSLIVELSKLKEICNLIYDASCEFDVPYYSWHPVVLFGNNNSDLIRFYISKTERQDKIKGLRRTQTYARNSQKA